MRTRSPLSLALALLLLLAAGCSEAASDRAYGIDEVEEAFLSNGVRLRERQTMPENELRAILGSEDPGDEVNVFIFQDREAAGRYVRVAFSRDPEPRFEVGPVMVFSARNVVATYEQGEGPASSKAVTDAMESLSE